VNAIDTKAIVWQPWSKGTRNPGYVLGLAEDRLNAFGITLVNGEPPDGWAELDCDRWAFRFDTVTPRKPDSIVAIASICHDAEQRDGDWHNLSNCFRVEIVRGAP
jgi:hypothetical protein